MDTQQRMENFFDRLWPISRSITGEGYRQSLDILSEIVPFDRIRFKSGSRALDWVVPPEWTARDAYLVDPAGRKRADFKTNNLHLVGYSTPFRGRLTLEQLKPHLHTIPDRPTAIPYVISYYEPAWGFCLSHEEFMALPPGTYDVVVDTELKDGHVEIGESVLRGESADEIFFSTNLCHPSLANNELSGPLVMTFLYERLARMPDRRFTYRFAVMPETIGAICYLSVRGEHLRDRMRAGFQITCAGDRGKFTYKLSRQGNCIADRAARLVLRDAGDHQIIPFDPAIGSDERQYGSPGFDLPVGSLMRTPYMRYPEYHTSLDNRSFISFEKMEKTVDAYADISYAIENNRAWKNTVMKGEPQIGRRGLYFTDGTPGSKTEKHKSLFWLLNLADGSNDLLAIAERSGQSVRALVETAAELERAGLLTVL